MFKESLTPRPELESGQDPKLTFGTATVVALFSPASYPPSFLDGVYREGDCVRFMIQPKVKYQNMPTMVPPSSQTMTPPA